MTTATGRSNSFLKSYIRGEMLLGGWNTIGKVLTAISALLVITHLSIFTYGAYILIFAFHSLVAGLFLSFLENVVFNDIARFISEGKESSAKRLFLEITAVRIITGAVLTVGIFLGAHIVANFYGEDIAILIRVLSALFLIGAVSTSMRMLFRARLHFGLIASRQIVHKVIQLFFLFYFLFFSELTIQTVLISYVSASFLTFTIFVTPFIKIYQPWRRVKAVPQLMLLLIIKTYMNIFDLFVIDYWVFIGLFGQFFFFLRFVVQWTYSEKMGQSVIPVHFWYLSIIGALIVLVYAIQRQDIVFIIGQSLAMLIYIRNLFLMKKTPRSH